MRGFLVDTVAYLGKVRAERAINARKLASGKYEKRVNPETGEIEIVRRQKQDLPECGARCKSDGHPCRAKVVPGYNRCRMHGCGGRSEDWWGGPKTKAGSEAIAASNRRRAEARRQQQDGS